MYQSTEILGLREKALALAQQTEDENAARHFLWQENAGQSKKQEFAQLICDCLLHHGEDYDADEDDDAANILVHLDLDGQCVAVVGDLLITEAEDTEDFYFRLVLGPCPECGEMRYSPDFSELLHLGYALQAGPHHECAGPDVKTAPSPIEILLEEIQGTALEAPVVQIVRGLMSLVDTAIWAREVSL